jgi:ketosteroid isomerase-like protein
MSQENVEIVRGLLEPFAGINVTEIDFSAEAVGEAVVRVHAPEVELTTLASGLGSGVGEHYRGLDGVVRYLGEWLDPFSDYRIENIDYIDAGEFVLVPSRQWGIGSTSGIRVEIELTTLYELRNGRIARIHQYDTLAEAQEAAGGSSA